jgi:hypothetical protein
MIDPIVSRFVTGMLAEGDWTPGPVIAAVKRSFR